MVKQSLFTALLVLGSLFSINASAQSKEETAVAQAVDKLKALMIDPDKGKLEAITADGLSYGHSSGKLENKAAFIDALVSGTSDFKSIELSDQTITVVDNTALVRHKLVGETMDNGKPGQPKLSVLLVWVKHKGDWKLLARQAVKI